MDVWGALDDGQVIGTLQLLRALGEDPRPALQEVADLGESTTRLRFRTQRGPDGRPWHPSLRAQLVGGRTLTKDGHLSGSAGSNATREFAEWGVNRIYARIHQDGGVIKAKGGGALKFPLPGGGFAVVKAVRMPARPYLGVNEDDRGDILDIFERRIVATSGGAAHAG